MFNFKGLQIIYFCLTALVIPVQAKVAVSLKVGGGMIRGNSQRKVPSFNINKSKTKNNEKPTFQDIVIENYDQNSHLIVSALSSALDTYILYREDPNSVDAFSKILDGTLFVREAKPFNIPVGYCGLDFTWHSGNLFYGLNIGMHQGFGSYYSYKVEEVDLVAISTAKEFLLKCFETKSDFITMLLSKEEAGDLTQKLNKKFNVLLSLGEKFPDLSKKEIDLKEKWWEIRMYAERQYYAGPFIGWNFNKRVNASFMLAVATKRSKFELKKEKNIIKIPGDLVYGIMPCLQLQFALNERFAAYLQAGYVYYFDPKKKIDKKELKIPKPKTEHQKLNFVIDSLDKRGAKGVLNITGGVAIKLF